MSSPSLVLVTGGNGFVGYAVLAGLLRNGYHVRAAVRRQDAIHTISRGPTAQTHLASGALSFALVPDYSKPGAFLETAKDCSYIVHLASPLALQPGDLVSQAVAGTKAILEAAEATPSVERVVFTSSVASIRPFERLFLDHPDNQAIISGRADEVQILTADTRLPTKPPVSDETPGFLRYINSKVAALNTIYDYSATHELDSHFSIVNLLPGWILGPEELARKKQEAMQGSNMLLGWLFQPVTLAPLVGLPMDENPPVLAETVHLSDVVESHVKALDIVKVPGHLRNFLLCSDSPTGPVFMDAVDIVRETLPHEVAEGKIPFAGELGTIPSKFDATPTARDLLGHDFLPFGTQVKDLVEWFIHLDD